MKKIYIVTNCGYRPAVAFESEERAKAVRNMCGGSIDEVQVIDAELSTADLLVHVSKHRVRHRGQLPRLRRGGGERWR